jgi:site-specific recombinase XerD
MKLRPLAPRTVKQYDRIMARAFNQPSTVEGLKVEVDGWKNSVKYLLRAAVTRRCAELEVPADGILKLIRPTYEARRVVQGLPEAEVQAWEAQAALAEQGKRAALLVLPALGLRASELLTLEREAVEHAVADSAGELKVLRKGGKERILPAIHIRALLEEMLTTTAAPRRTLLGRPPVDPGRWKMVGELFNRGELITQYHALRNLVERTGKEAKIRRRVRPHLLRHAFATRMKARGMPDLMIQAMLGHASFVTTARYLHGDTAGATKFLVAVALPPRS